MFRKRRAFDDKNILALLMWTAYSRPENIFYFIECCKRNGRNKTEKQLLIARKCQTAISQSIL